MASHAVKSSLVKIVRLRAGKASPCEVSLDVSAA